MGPLTFIIPWWAFATFWGLYALSYVVFLGWMTKEKHWDKYAVLMVAYTMSWSLLSFAASYHAVKITHDIQELLAYPSQGGLQ